MKRLSEADRRRHVALMRRRTQKAARRSFRMFELRNSGLDHHSKRDERPATIDQPKAHRVIAPGRLTLDPTQTEETYKFLGDIRDAADVEAANVIVDFTNCAFVGVEMMLALHAELYRLRARKGTESVRGVLPTDADVKLTLQRLGLLPALRGEAKQLQGVSYDPNAQVPQSVVVETGIALDGSESLGIARTFAQGLNLDDASYKPIHSALNDALENISEHGYEGADSSEERRWWACAISKPTNPTSYLLAYDLGVTIPATVPRTAQKGGQSAVKALLGILKRETADGAPPEELLLAAFDPSVTRREGGKGGRGLPRMRQLADQYEGGSLAVWSGQAVATTYGDGDITAVKVMGNLRGTFVIWRIQSEVIK